VASEPPAVLPCLRLSDLPWDDFASSYWGGSLPV